MISVLIIITSLDLTKCLGLIGCLINMEGRKGSKKEKRGEVYEISNLT